MCSPINQLAQVLRNFTEHVFDWSSKKKTFDRFLKTYLAKASDIGLTPEALEDISLTAAKNYKDYEYANYNWLPFNSSSNLEYNGMPYIVYVDKNDETWIIFRTKTHAVPKITLEMMDMIKYMGVVRVHIGKKFLKAIPAFPDNVIQIQFESEESLHISDMIDFHMPAYVRGFFDLTKWQYMPRDKPLKYVNHFPSTLLYLETSEPVTPNLPDGLISICYNQGMHYSDDILLVQVEHENKSPLLEYLPRTVKKVVVSGSDFTTGDLTISSRCVDYLEFSIGHITDSNILRIDGASTVCIKSFETEISQCIKPNRPQITNFVNLEKIYEGLCNECEDGTIRQDFEQVVTVSLGESVEHLILNNSCKEIIILLKYFGCDIPSKLEKVTIHALLEISNLDDVIKHYERTKLKLDNFIKQHGYSSDMDLQYYFHEERIYSDEYFVYKDLEIYKIILDFHAKFPNVEIIFCY